jgi:hypothetical protein
MKRKIRITESELTNLIRQTIKEQVEVDNSLDELFSSNNVQMPSACEQDENKVPSIDIQACTRETVKMAQGYLTVLEQLAAKEPGMKTKEYNLPIGESKRKRYYK